MAQPVAFMDDPVNAASEQPSGTKGAIEHNLLNPTPGNVPDRQFLFYSRGVSQEKGKGLSELFHAIGSAANSAIEGVDTLFKSRIKNDLYSQIDPLRDQTEAAQFGKMNVGAPAVGSGLPNQATTPPPEGVKNQLQGLANYKAAADQGHIPHIYYEMQLNSIAKSMRAQYSGYRDYIDQEISHITGGNPANKVIQELFAANRANSTRQDEQEKSWHSLYLTAIKEVPGAAFALQNEATRTGQRPSLDFLSTMVNNELGAKAQTSRAINDLRLAKDRGEADVTTVHRTATRDMASALRDSIKEGGSLFSDTTQLRSIVKDVELHMGDAGYHMSPAQFAQGQQLVSKIGEGIRATQNKILTDPLYDSLDEKAKAGLKKMGEDLIENLTATFAGKEFKPGLAHSLANILDQIGHGDELDVMKASEALRLNAVLNKKMGAQGAALMLNFQKDLPFSAYSRIGTDVQNLMTQGLGKIAEGSGTLGDAIKSAGPVQPGAASTVINAAVRGMISENSNPEGVANLVKGIFAADAQGQTFLTEYGPNGKPIIPSRDERNRIFTTLTSPKVIETMTNLTKQGVISEAEWLAVQNFTSKFVEQNIYKDMEMVQGTNQPQSWYKVVFDPTSNRFFSVQNQGVNGGGIDPMQAKANADRAAYYLNGHLDPLIRITQARGFSEDNVHQGLKEVFMRSGMSLDDMTVGGTPTSTEGKAQGRVSR